MENKKSFEQTFDYKEIRIPFLSGRPDREAVINNDDVTNLVILLNTTASVSEFLAVI